MKKNKKIIIGIIIGLIICFFVIKGLFKNTKSGTYADIPIVSSATVTIEKSDETIVTLDNLGIEQKYNVLMLPIDETFESMFDDYKSGENISLVYNDTTLEIKPDEEIITVPTEYDNTDEPDACCDYSVDIEIEEINGVKYIPSYLISNISGIDVNVDGTKIYDDIDYCTSISAIDKNKTEHSIEIQMTATPDEKNGLSQSKYIYEAQDGALWREEAYKRIEKYRKSDINITVTDSKGQTLDGAEVNIEMTKNDFLFGTSLDWLGSWAAEPNNRIDYGNPLYPNSIVNNSEITNKLFNIIGSSQYFKWEDEYWVTTQYKIRENVIEYAQNHDMAVRGHTLWWDDEIGWGNTSTLVGDTSNPKEGTMAYIFTKHANGEITDEEAESLSQTLQTNLENMILEHIKSYVSQYQYITEWDVVNEPDKIYWQYNLYDTNANNGQRNYLRSNYDYSDHAYWEQKISWWYGVLQNYTPNENYCSFLGKCYDTARQYNPTAKLILNDNSMGMGYTDGTQNKFYLTNKINTINTIKNYTKNLDSIGFQYHTGMYSDSTGGYVTAYHHTPQWYYNNINYVLEKTNTDDAVITEYDNIYASTDEDKEYKAKYLKDTLISAYSNKNVSEFSFWSYNSTDSFIEEEWKAYEETISEWLDDKQTLNADINGVYNANAYKGEYKVTISKKNYATKEITVKVGATTDQNISLNLIGDINGDGVVNTTDVGMANAYIKNTIELTDYQIKCADVNGDGTVDETDVEKMNEHATNVSSLWN